MKTAKLDNFTKSQKPWEVEGVEWQEVRLGDKMVGEIIMGQSPPSSSYNKEGKGVPFLQGNKEFGKFYPKHVMFTTDPKKIVKKGYVLLSVRAPVGDVNIADREYCIGRGLAAIRFNGEPKYLFYLLVSIKEKLEDLGKRGTTFKAITKNHLKNLKLPLPFRNGKPDLETQKKIVEYIEANFSRIDAILEKKKKELEQLDELWESVLEQAFKPKEGEEWREVIFTDTVEILDKYRIPVKKKDRKPGPYPYCGANGVIDFVDGYTHDGEFLMLAEDGGFFGKREATAYIMKGKFWANNHVHVLKAKPNISLRFLFHFSILYDFTPHLRGATRPKLSQTGMKRIKLPLPFRNNQPDLEKQKEIATYLDSVYEKIKTLKEKIQKQITQLEEIRESILDEVFNHDETG